MAEIVEMEGVTLELFGKYNDILSVTDLCKALGIGKNTAYSLLKSGQIKSIRIGKVHKIPKVCLVQYIEDCDRICTES